MASNFRISKHQNSESLHLKLMGDFDSRSALELLNILKKRCRSASKIFIHCNCLSKIEPIGREVFHSNLNSLTEESLSLLFTGEKAREIAPEGRQCL